MSGYGPFSWSYGLSVLKTIAEPTWHYNRNQQKSAEEITWEARDPKQHLNPRLPFATYIGWALLRIALCVDIALINELVGYFVLNAAHFKRYSFQTHRNPYAVTFIGAVGGAISTILVFIIDIIYSRPEQRDRWPMLDPNGHIPTATDPSNGHLKGLADLLGKEFTPEREKGDARAKSSSKLSMIGDKRDAKNMTEGGPITLTKLRIHAVMRIVIWTAAACIAGSSGTAIWFVKDGGTVRRLEDRVLTGVIVQCVGVAVIVVGPTILQLMYLIVEIAETASKKRKPRRNKNSS